MKYIKALLFGAIMSSCAPQICKGPDENNEQKRVRLGENYDACVEALPGHNDIRVKRINLIFVGVNHDVATLDEKVQETLGCTPEEGIFSIEPLLSNATNINFWKVPVVRDVATPARGWQEYGDEGGQIAKELSEKCQHPNKSTISFQNWFFRPNAYTSALRYIEPQQMNLARLALYQDQFKYVTKEDCKKEILAGCRDDTAICLAIQDLRGKQDPTKDANICSIITQGEIPFGTAYISSHSGPKTVRHELGHSLFGLYDEYLEAGKIDDENLTYINLESNPVNCFIGTKEECEINSPWGKDCFQGCYYTQEILGTPIWRSVNQGIMSESSEETFGLFNEQRIRDTFYILNQTEY